METAYITAIEPNKQSAIPIMQKALNDITAAGGAPWIFHGTIQALEGSATTYVFQPPQYNNWGGIDYNPIAARDGQTVIMFCYHNIEDRYGYGILTTKDGIMSVEMFADVTAVTDWILPDDTDSEALLWHGNALLSTAVRNAQALSAY